MPQKNQKICNMDKSYNMHNSQGKAKNIQVKTVMRRLVCMRLGVIIIS